MAPRPAKVKIRDVIGPEDEEVLDKIMRAGMDGLRRSRWQIGYPPEYLVAAIVVRVLVVIAQMHNAAMAADG